MGTNKIIRYSLGNAILSKSKRVGLPVEAEFCKNHVIIGNEGDITQLQMRIVQIVSINGCKIIYSQNKNIKSRKRKINFLRLLLNNVDNHPIDQRQIRKKFQAILRSHC